MQGGGAGYHSQVWGLFAYMATEADIAAADEYLAERKALHGPIPQWRKSTFDGEQEAIWNIEDSVGILRGQLRFRFPRPFRAFPSISVIFRTNSIWRIDLAPPDLCKSNPFGAMQLGLPATVCGSHGHEWPDNRDFVLRSPTWHLPHRRPIQPQIKRLPQALYFLADQINLVINSDQRGFDVPPQSDLFEDVP